MTSSQGPQPPTYFLSPKGGLRMKHHGYVYCQDMSNEAGTKYFRCENSKRRGCKGRLKSTAVGIEVTRPHTCRPADSFAEVQRPQAKRPTAQRPRVQRPPVEMPRVQRPPVQRPVQRSQMLSPTSYLGPTGGVMKRHAGYEYKQQYSRPSGYRYYACVHKRHGCPGSLSCTAHVTRPLKGHTCRPLSPDVAGRPLAPVDRGTRFEPITSPVRPVSEQVGNGRDHIEDAETNDPFQLEMDYLRQKMEIGELTKQKLQLEIHFLQRSAESGRRARRAVAPPSGAPGSTQVANATPQPQASRN